MANFKQRWHIKSNWQLFVILLVFAATGFSAKYISGPILALFGIAKGSVSNWIYYPLYIILLFPIYQVLLVFYGFLFGQFNRFWTFEKKMLRACKLGFIADWFEKK